VEIGFKGKEIDVLRVLYRLEKTEENITPTMISDAMGLDCCARIVEERKRLVRKDLITFEQIHRSKAYIGLTDKGREVAKDLGKFIYTKRKTYVLQDKVTGWVDPDEPGLAEPGKMPKQLITNERINYLYNGRKYGINNT